MSLKFPTDLNNEQLFSLHPNIVPISNSYGSMFGLNNIVLPPGVLSTNHSHGCMLISESVMVKK